MLPPLDDNEDNPFRLWAEIHKLRHEVKGPDGFETWRDAAIDERRRRVELQKKYDELGHHVVFLLDGTWSYLHNHCTIQSIKDRWTKVRDLVQQEHDE